jgi:Stigma-specific protein, Stig1
MGCTSPSAGCPSGPTREATPPNTPPLLRRRSCRVCSHFPRLGAPTVDRVFLRGRPMPARGPFDCAKRTKFSPKLDRRLVAVGGNVPAVGPTPAARGRTTCCQPDGRPAARLCSKRQESRPHMKLKHILIIPALFVFAAGVAQTGFANPACPAVGAQICGATSVTCNGSCVPAANLASDVNNCGACGKVCAAGQQCYAGICAVPASNSLVVCSGTCVDPSRQNTCGSCGNVCAAGSSCLPSGSSYACGCTTAGQTYCGASISCVNLATDTNNCGKCASKCMPNATCSSGVCACPAGFVNCGGTIGCINQSTDPKNCGGCGKACASGKACVSGACST